MNARQRRRCVRRLYIFKEGRCFRHPDVPVSWEFPTDLDRREWLAGLLARDAGIYAKVAAANRKRGRHGLTFCLWASLCRRAAMMLRHPDPPAWWFERKSGRFW